MGTDAVKLQNDRRTAPYDSRTKIQAVRFRYWKIPDPVDLSQNLCLTALSHTSFKRTRVTSIRRLFIQSKFPKQALFL